jgi:nucleoside-diphosphate-sugar epimerase
VHVVVVGATGNVGTSLLSALAREDAVTSVLGIARRLPGLRVEKVTWAQADVAVDELAPHFRGADCVVHLAWLIQPSRDQELLWRVNVDGSSRVFRAARDAGVRSLVYASSVGAYSPGPKDRRVDEAWPRDGVPTNYYSRQKAEVERRLDDLEREAPDVRVVRMRPAFIFKRESASGQRRLFAGPFLPTPLLRSALFPLVPTVRRLRFQAVHADDVADAYRRAIVGDARGPFNIAADPDLDLKLIAREIGARTFPLPGGLLRAAVAAAWRLRLVPVDEGWVDAGLQSPLLDPSRARLELGWTPRVTALEAITEAAVGMREGAGADTPPLEPGHLLSELTTGIGARDR